MKPQYSEKAQELLAQVSTWLSENGLKYTPHFLTGSYAFGCETKMSDVDIVVSIVRKPRVVGTMNNIFNLIAMVICGLSAAFPYQMGLDGLVLLSVELALINLALFLTSKRDSR